MTCRSQINARKIQNTSTCSMELRSIWIITPAFTGQFYDHFPKDNSRFPHVVLSLRKCLRICQFVTISVLFKFFISPLTPEGPAVYKKIAIINYFNVYGLAGLPQITIVLKINWDQLVCNIIVKHFTYDQWSDIRHFLRYVLYARKVWAATRIELNIVTKLCWLQNDWQIAHTYVGPEF